MAQSNDQKREARRDRRDAQRILEAADYMANGYHVDDDNAVKSDRDQWAAWKRLTIGEWNALKANMTADELAEYRRIRRAMR